MGPTDPFRALLLSIAQELTSANFKDMKFACGDVIPGGILEKLARPIDLFTELEHGDLLTEKKKDFLADLLWHVGRQELARKLFGMHEKASKLKRSCSVLRGTLPGKVPHFLGRTLVCEEIIAALHKGQNHLVSITAPPGYGKSAVAIGVGHEMVESLGYNVYYVSMRGASSVDSIAFQLLYSLGVVAGDDPITQVHHHFEVTQEETLLILDNVEDMLQPDFKPHFLKFIKLIGEKGPHVKMIVTSRVALMFYSFDVKNVLLQPLTDNQSAQLISIFSPQEITSSCALALAHLCKGIPLLLRAVASLLEKNVDPELLIKEFERSPGSTLKSLCFDGTLPELDMYPCLKLCFDRLNSDLQQHLVALSVFPSSFKTVDASCVLHDMSNLQRQLIINQLVDNSFLRPDTEGRSFFAVHSIVQIFCHELLKENDELKLLHERALNNFNFYFLSILLDLNEKFYGSSDELKEALGGFECQKNNIFRALENSIHDKKLVNHGADLLNSTYRFFTYRLSSAEFRRIYRNFAEFYKGSPDKKRYSHCLVSLASHQFWIMCSCRKPCPTATKMFKEAYEVQEKLGLTNTERYAECLSKLARAYAFDGDLPTSVAMVDEAHTIVENGGFSNISKLSVLNDYAAVYSYHERHETAVKLRERFLPIAKEHMKDHPSVGILYEELGSSYEALRNTRKSMECRKEAIRIFQGFLGDHKLTASSYLGLGTTLRSIGDYNAALAALRKALEIQRKTIGPHEETIITSQEIEKVLKILGNDREAEEAAKFSQKLIEDQRRNEKSMEDLKI